MNQSRFDSQYIDKDYESIPRIIYDLNNSPCKNYNRQLEDKSFKKNSSKKVNFENPNSISLKAFPNIDIDKMFNDYDNFLRAEGNGRSLSRKSKDSAERNRGNLHKKY